MPCVFENPVTRGNKHKGDHFYKACNNLLIFCHTLFYDFYNKKKKGLFKKVYILFVCKHVFLAIKINKIYLKLESDPIKKNIRDKK